jgi:putative SOS response-associated peptidase YedK
LCNRYRMSASRQELLARYGIKVEPPFETWPVGELFPKRIGAIVRSEGEERVLDLASWGFPPPAAGRAPVTNVRNLASPFWRGAVSRPDRRCLVPFSDFCEWEGEKGSKIARWFSVPTQPITSFAGVWRPTDAGTAYAFLTTEPNPLVAAVHPKAMPVLLHPEDEDTWLTGDFDTACALATPFPSQLMTMA